MILVFDSETTGKADFNAPFMADHQPHLVQLGAQLLDEEFIVRGEINFIIRPVGFVIHDEVAAIHGISHGIAEKCGVDVHDALAGFTALAAVAQVFVAHNLQFDSLVLSAAQHRLFGDGDRWLNGPAQQFCTMKAMTNVCKLPGRRGDYKWPKLQEAYRHCFGEEFKGAHDAMADVRACARIYRFLKEAPPPTIEAPVKEPAGGVS